MSIETVYGKLSRQPLSLVLAEFSYSTVLKMADHIPDLQEQYRKDFPTFSVNQGRSVNITPDGVQVGASTSWVFVSADKRKAINIDQRRLVYFCTDYNRFPEFKKECVTALSVLKGVVEPGLLEKVGLRYNDVVVPGKGESLETYLKPSFIAPMSLEETGNTIIQNRTETAVKTSSGMLAVRTLIGSSGLVVMPDFHGSVPVKIGNIAPPGEICAVLDFDHSWAAEAPVEFSPNIAGVRLESLHIDARNAFWNITTKKATEELWK